MATEKNKSEDNNTNLEAGKRKTGSGTQGDTRGASAAEPGKGSNTQAGDPNQGTEAR